MLSPFEACVGTNNHSRPGHISVGCDLLGFWVDFVKAIAISSIAAILSLSPVHFRIVNLTSLRPNFFTTRLLGICSYSGSAHLLRVTKTIRPITAKAIKADVVFQAKNVIGAE